MMEKEFDLLVFIGRFQPFHLEHKRIIDIALQKSRHVLVLIGSAGKARTVRNPFTYQERKRMIQKNYPSRYFGEGSVWTSDDKALVFRPLFDKTYNDAAWIKQVQDNVISVAMDIANPSQSDQLFRPNGIKQLKIGLIGAAKDHTSFYLKMFPQWDSVNVNIETELNSTEIREAWFTGVKKPYGLDLVPDSVNEFMFEEFMSGVEGGFVDTNYFKQLQNESLFIAKYKESWKAAPYPVKHATIDAVVEQSGHVLLVKRRSEPGKGLWALPGGHLNEFERQEDGMIRELKEETKIKVPEAVLRGSIVNQRTFDDPHRSTLGRVITQAYHIKLRDAIDLPAVKGADDAEKAQWVPIAELSEDQLFDDHFAIISWFLSI